MPEEDVRRRLWALEEAQRRHERELEETRRELERAVATLREAIDRMTSDAMVETEVQKRLARRDRARVDWTIKLLGGALVALQVYSAVKR